MSSMTDLRPLPIWWAKPPTDADWQRIRQAKAALKLDFLVQPGRASAGSPGRILAVGGKPDFVCDYATVADTRSAGLQIALNWVLGTHDDPRAVTMPEMLTEIFGKEVKEVINEHEGTVDERTPIDPGSEDEGPYRQSIRTEAAPRSAPTFR